MTNIRSWVRRTAIVGTLIALAGCQGETQDATTQNYRSFLTIDHVKSQYYTEPKTGVKYPLVEGALSNIGGKTLIVVELTVRFKNSTQKVIYEEQAYPIYVSDFGKKPDENEVLKPGEKTRFAFKAPKCPHDWQPGAVAIEITKIVFAKDSAA